MLWNVEKATVDSTVVFDAPVLFAQLHPYNEYVLCPLRRAHTPNAHSELCLAVTVSDAPYLIDLKTKEKKAILKEPVDEKDKRPPSAVRRSALVDNMTNVRTPIEIGQERRYAEPGAVCLLV